MILRKRSSLENPFAVIFRLGDWPGDLIKDQCCSKDVEIVFFSKDNKIFFGKTESYLRDKDVSGKEISIKGENFYKIENNTIKKIF